MDANSGDVKNLMILKEQLLEFIFKGALEWCIGASCPKN